VILYMLVSSTRPSKHLMKARGTSASTYAVTFKSLVTELWQHGNPIPLIGVVQRSIVNEMTEECDV